MHCLRLRNILLWALMLLASANGAWAMGRLPAPHSPQPINVMVEQQRIHVFFTGKVQGVGFRQSTRQFALDLGLKGWVRNLADARVEMVAEGGDLDLQMLLGKLRAEFQIEKVELRHERADGRFKGFEIVD